MDNDIIHMRFRGHYLCNWTVPTTKNRLTFIENEVTCQSCLQIMSKRVNGEYVWS